MHKVVPELSWVLLYTFFNRIAMQFTLGIEEEYQVIDPATRELVSHQNKIVTEAEKVMADQATPEMHEAPTLKMPASKLPFSGRAFATLPMDWALRSGRLVLTLFRTGPISPLLPRSATRP